MALGADHLQLHHQPLPSTTAQSCVLSHQVRTGCISLPCRRRRQSRRTGLQLFQPAWVIRRAAST